VSDTASADETDDGPNDRIPTDWAPLLADLDRRHREATAMGGEDKLARQRSKGRLDARARLDLLFDEGTFVELGPLAAGAENTAPADGLVAGSGLVDGWPVAAGAEDFTVKGGSIGVANNDKRVRLTELAKGRRIPMVLLLDGAGHRLTGGEGAGRRPNDLQGLADLSGQVPLVAVVLGPSAGHGALGAVLSDYVVMTEGASMFAAGPGLVQGATGETVTPTELGGAEIHGALSGVAHDVVADDHEAIGRARAWLSYLPSNAWSRPATQAGGDDAGPRDLRDILELVPADNRRPYAMTPVLEAVVDAGSLLVVQSRFGSGMVTALGRLGGRSVAIVANDPSHRAGAIGVDEARKATHFVEVADAFHLPVVFLADNPGVMAGTEAERSGALRAAAGLYVAQRRVRSPKLHVTVRKAFGFGSSVMGMNPFDDQTVTLAFPGVSLASMPAGSGAAAAGLAPDDREAVQTSQGAGPYRTAGAMGYDDVIDPRQMRNRLLSALATIAATGPAPEPRSPTGIAP
jgi:acetyl-CoA carboxylase carboxyltransferase component